MKTKISLVAIITLLLSSMCMQAQSASTAKKILVVYFSHSGNTRVIANQIKELTGGDIFEIQPVKAYPSDYQTCVDQAKKEINANYKPALKTKLKNIRSYDIIFVGSPCWWATMAPPVATFLTSYDFTGKTIIPFMTHEGSRMGRYASDIKKLCPKSILLEGLPIRGSSVKDAKGNVNKWLRDIKVIN